MDQGELENEFCKLFQALDVNNQQCLFALDIANGLGIPLPHVESQVMKGRHYLTLEEFSVTLSDPNLSLVPTHSRRDSTEWFSNKLTEIERAHPSLAVNTLASALEEFPDNDEPVSGDVVTNVPLSSTPRKPQTQTTSLPQRQQPQQRQQTTPTTPRQQTPTTPRQQTPTTPRQQTPTTPRQQTPTTPRQQQTQAPKQSPSSIPSPSTKSKFGWNRESSGSTTDPKQASFLRSSPNLSQPSSSTATNQDDDDDTFGPSIHSRKFSDDLVLEKIRKVENALSIDLPSFIEDDSAIHDDDDTDLKVVTDGPFPLRTQNRSRPRVMTLFTKAPPAASQSTSGSQSHRESTARATRPYSHSTIVNSSTSLSAPAPKPSRIGVPVETSSSMLSRAKDRLRLNKT
eukprot:c1321_g1_i1.p1 GENE.c1321_g1_i1~~c1321_g1_i1.p1  ORF type:complete len:399 (+),score=120.08 c1321_g1_i1:39-1235(+)